MSNAPFTTRRFLIVDHNPDTAELLRRSLQRKFGDAVFTQTSDLDEAVKTIGALNTDAVVIHRADDADAVAATKVLRSISHSVPIIIVSSVDRSEPVLAAGATGFLNLEQWLLLGSVVANAMAHRTSTATP